MPPWPLDLLAAAPKTLDYGSELTLLMLELGPGVAATLELFASRLARRLALRWAADVTNHSNVEEWLREVETVWPT